MNATTARRAPLTPPTAAKLAAAAGMTRTAFRVQVEYRTLITFTELLAQAEASAVDPLTGRLDAAMGRRVEALIRQRLSCVLDLLDLGVPASVVSSVTGNAA
jgi:hypothetical protein